MDVRYTYMACVHRYTQKYGVCTHAIFLTCVYLCIHLYVCVYIWHPSVICVFSIYVHTPYFWQKYGVCTYIENTQMTDGCQIYTHTHKCIHRYTHVRNMACVHIYTYIYICVCVYIYMYICFVYMYVYVYVYIYIFDWLQSCARGYTCQVYDVCR